MFSQANRLKSFLLVHIHHTNQLIRQRKRPVHIFEAAEINQDVYENFVGQFSTCCLMFLRLEFPYSGQNIGQSKISSLTLLVVTPLFFIGLMAAHL